MQTKKYLVLKKYKSHAAQYEAGQVVELELSFAAWVNRDQHETLADYAAPVVEPVKADRMVREPSKSRRGK